MTREEPDDHGIGRSRGGLSTKTHLLVDGHGRPLVIAVAAGQGGDSPMLIGLLGQLSVPRVGPGRTRTRTRPVSLAGDEAYFSKAIRGHLRARGITAVIPEPADQIGHRRRRGPAGGRPVDFDAVAVAYRRRNVVERSFNRLKQWRGLATRYDQPPPPTAAPSSWPQSSPGPNRETLPSRINSGVPPPREV